jgi:hypothetical protein
MRRSAAVRLIRGPGGALRGEIDRDSSLSTARFPATRFPNLTAGADLGT